MMKNHIPRAFIIRAIIILMLFLLFFLVFKYWGKITKIAYPFLVSLFLAYLLNPAVCYMERKGIKRILGIWIIFIFFIGILFSICFFLLPILVRDMGKLINILPQYTEEIRENIGYIQKVYSRSGLPDGIKNVLVGNINKLQNVIAVYLGKVMTFIMSTLSKIFSIALIPVLLYYFLKDFMKIIHGIKRIIPKKYRTRIVNICINIDEVFGDYIRTQLILSLIVAAMTTVSLMLLRINFALIIGIINGITNIIPYFGPIIGGIPAVVLALLQSPLKAVYTIIMLSVIQQVESDIICPRITADTVGLHPVTVMLSLLVGGEFFGMTGLILAIPVVAALKVIYKDVIKNLF
ncbi:MAG: AI-2E family transporter [Clostridiales bacterium]|nr:AI-2E family transporter [Clostridiales bacterium]